MVSHVLSFTRKDYEHEAEKRMLRQRRVLRVPFHSIARVPSIIPKPDRRIGDVMFVAERTKACCVQHQKLSGSRLESEPASGEHSQEMSARKNQDIAFDRAHTTDNTVGPGANLFRRFSIGATITE
jgi:hypothetical protein